MNDLPEPITTGRPGRGRWRTRLGLGLGGLAIGLLMAEVILWSSDLPQFPQPHSFPPQFMLVGRPDEQGWVHHVNKPSETIRFVYDGNPRGYFGSDNEVDHVTNSLGFRGDEFPLREKADGSIEAVSEKPAETVRIVFLGDSVTFGEGVKQKDTFVEQAAARLRETWEPEGRRLEVYNLGVGGHNTGDAAWTWQRYGHQLEPDVIVLEMGDGLLGTYGVHTLLADQGLSASLSAIVLCASDPVGAWGATKILDERFNLSPAVISGPVTDTPVGRRYCTETLGVPAHNALLDAESLAAAVAPRLSPITQVEGVFA